MHITSAVTLHLCHVKSIRPNLCIEFFEMISGNFAELTPFYDETSK